MQTRRLTAAFLLAFILVLIGALAERALGHSWYPVQCCSGSDCRPIDSKRVRITSDGFMIDEWYFIPHHQTHTSVDTRYHACWPKPDKLRCFFAPRPSV